MGSKFNLSGNSSEELHEPPSPFLNGTSESFVEFRFPYGLITGTVAVCSFLIVIGVIGNFLTIAALTKCRRLRSSTTVLVINLSAADLFFCACVMPVRIFMFTNLKNKINCDIFLFFFYGNATVSLVTMVAIAVNRYLLVLHNQLYRQVFTKKGTCVVVLVVWIYSFLVWSIPVIGSWTHFHVQPGTPFCRMKDESPKFFFGFFGFVLPCLAITIGYIAIFVAVKNSTIRVSSHQATPHRSSHIGFTRVLLIAYCSFMVFFLPNFIILMIPETRENPIALTIGEMLLWLSSCSNPIVYVLCSRHYRQAYTGILTFSRTEDHLQHENGSKIEVSLCRLPDSLRTKFSRDYSENFSSTVRSSE